MGHLLRSKYPDVVIQCRECGKKEGDDGDDFIHTFDDLMDLTEEEKKACEWFSERMSGEPFPDISEIAHYYTKEEMMHIFILDNLIEKLLTKKPICETCFANRGHEKTLS